MARTTTTYTATMTKVTRQFSQAHYGRYVAQEIRAMTKLRARGHRDFKDWTDADIRKAATDLARMNNAGEIYA